MVDSTIEVAGVVMSCSEEVSVGISIVLSTVGVGVLLGGVVKVKSESA